MSRDRMKLTRYSSTEELVAALKLESDNFDKVVIPSMPVLTIWDPETGIESEHHDVGMILCRCDGTQALIHFEDATRFIMDCLKNKRHIPVEISPRLDSIS